MGGNLVDAFGAEGGERFIHHGRAESSPPMRRRDHDIHKQRLAGWQIDRTAPRGELAAVDNSKGRPV